MTAFSEAVDVFLVAQKSAVGHLEWHQSRDQTGVSAFWLISTPTGMTDHRLHVVAYPREALYRLHGYGRIQVAGQRVSGDPTQYRQ
jgi:hypothetical protein